MIAVQFSSGPQWLRAFPIPTRSNVQIELAVDKAEAGQLLLYDVQGRLLRVQEASIRELSLTQLPAGLYLLRLSDAQGTTVAQQRLIKR